MEAFIHHQSTSPLRISVLLEWIVMIWGHSTFFKFSFCNERQSDLTSAQLRRKLADYFLAVINAYRRLKIKALLFAVHQRIKVRMVWPRRVFLAKQRTFGAEASVSSKNEKCIMRSKSIMMQLELVKVPEKHDGNPPDTHVRHNIGPVWRLVQSWDRNYLLIFSIGVLTCESTAEKPMRRGLKFTGVVKTAHSKYIMEYLTNTAVPGKFQHRTVFRKV